MSEPRGHSSWQTPPSSRPVIPELWHLRTTGALQILTATPLSELDWLVHGFSTRRGGASALDFSRDGQAQRERVCNLGFTDWDAPENVRRNRDAFCQSLGAGAYPLVVLRQIHSDAVLRAENGLGGSGTGDALIGAAPEILIAVQTADCVPILLADPVQRAIAVVHAGWRGTLQRIAGKTVTRMRMEFHSEPANLLAAIGPGIGVCCYEVGPEVVKQFESQFAAARDWFAEAAEGSTLGEDGTPLPWLSRTPPGHEGGRMRPRLDLVAANRANLLDAGMRAEKIFACGLCTVCRSDLFFSFRRERPTGRMMLAAGIRPL